MRWERWNSDRTRAVLSGALLVMLMLVVVWVGCGPRIEVPRLLLLISVDTLRADRLGAYGSTRELTPHLDELARRGVVFEAAYAASSFTLPSVAALQSGLYPSELGLWSNESKIPDTAPTLAARLRDAGWRTAAVVSNVVLHRGSGLARGFDLYDDELRQREATRSQRERIAVATTRDALSVVDACTDSGAVPCFVWIHYQDPHGPYTPPAAMRTRYLEAEMREPDGAQDLEVLDDHSGLGGIPRYQYLEGRRDVAFYRAGYDAEIRTVDEQIGELLGRLGERGLAERTAVVFTADHGESLGEDDHWFGHGEYLSDAVIRVPLLIAAPGLTPSRRRDVASHVDVHATLLGLAGLDLDPGTRGRDLLASGAEQRASRPLIASLGGSSVRRYAIVDGDRMLVISQRGGGSDDWDAALRNTVTGAPQSRDATVGEHLQGELLALVAETAGPEGERRVLPEEHRVRLRELGYLE
jgi:arylsulfatase